MKEGLSCPACGEAVKENWKFCPACARPLAPAPPVAGSPAADGAFIEPEAGMEFIRVPGGVFEMGDLFGDGWGNETPVHAVRLSGYAIAKFPVTQGQWERLMGGNPSRFRRGADYPVEQVGWREVLEFIARLNAAAAGRPRFRLPTEAEWEYAARSGGRRELYAGGGDVEAVAWTADSSAGSTRPVGRKRPNGLGLYDMSGNVWEWCLDVYDEKAYAAHAAENPLLKAGGPDQVIRGGSWNLDAWSARCSRRFSMARDFAGAGLGFRLVMAD